MSGTNPANQLVMSMTSFLGRPATVIAGGVLVTLYMLVHRLHRLPAQLMKTGDSNAYLTLESFRPPLYGWFLHAWQALHGSLSGLPGVQFVLLLAALLAFAVEFGLMLRNALVSTAIIPAVMAQPAIYDAPSWMMTECVYLCAILCGMALQFRYVRRGGASSLVGAALLFGLATITRSTGIVFLLLPVGAALLDRRRRPPACLIRAAASTLAGSLVMLCAMSWNAQRHGHFEIGSWAGISLLTKALPLTTASDVAGMPPPLRAVAPVAATDRLLIAAQPDLASRLRAQVQMASSDLRWGVFIPDAQKTWPAWQRADWRRRGEMAGAVSWILIRRHPLGALSLWAHDWLSLVVQPAYWPAAMTKVSADQSAFYACREQSNCWALARYDLPLSGRIVLLGVSTAGAAAALVLILLRGWPVLRRRAAPATTLFVLTALVIHGSLLLSSAFEAGHVRYTVAMHVLELPLLLWTGSCVLRRGVSHTRRRRWLSAP